MMRPCQLGSLLIRAKIIALVSLLLTSSVSALGIGEISVSSALNQNLDAKIPLIIAPGEKVANITVNLAPPDKFTEAGISWTPFLSKIKFQTITDATNAVTIKLTSNEAVIEPYLNFLLQVLSPNASLYREFTVLLDPPASYLPEPLTTASDQLRPLDQTIVNPSSDLQLPIMDTSVYGPTTKNDTLWKISEQLSRQAKVSVEQMMLAIYAANPKAFYNANIHALLAGVKLKIPERDIALKVSRKQALEEYHIQTAAWKNQQTALTTEPALPEQKQPDQQLTLAAPPQEEATSDGIIAPQSEQTDNKNNTELLEKETESPEAPIESNLQDRIVTLEQQLTEAQQKLVEKDQQLNALQEQLKANSLAEAVKKVPALPISPPITPAESGQKTATVTIVIWALFTILLLAVTGWFLWRRYKQNSSTITDIFASSNSTLDEKNTTNPEGKKIAPFFDEVDLENTNKIDMSQNEINPIAVTDIYLAYGRYQQAEDLIRDEIEDHPDNDELLVKLLEIYYLANKKDAFLAYATQLANAGRRSDVEFWTTVKQMGSELCPESPLFTTQGTVKPPEKTVYVAKEAPSISLEPSKITLPITIDTISVPSSVTEDTQEQQQSNSLEFDLSAAVLEQAEDERVKAPEFDQINLEAPLFKTNANNPLQRDFYTHSVNQSNQDEQQTRFDLTDMDEMETKLDLAKAYIDMSDSDSAKEMIAEVIKKGTEQQRLIAQSLLKDVK